jgi:hypothetical protein
MGSDVATRWQMRRWKVTPTQSSMWQLRSLGAPRSFPETPAQRCRKALKLPSAGRLPFAAFALLDVEHG